MQSQADKDIKTFRIKASIKLVQNLQQLFAKMVRSNKKYVDPSNVLQSVVDDIGQYIPIGDQKDVTEYHLNFLSRVEEAIHYLQIKKGGTKEVEEMTSYMGISQGKFSTTKVQEKTMIMNHFFGKMNQTFSYSQDGEKVEKVEEMTFGPLIMDIAFGELYSAFENYCHYKIEDFRAPSGEKVIAQADSWIIRPPECMFFQLQRVVFDIKSGMPVKLHDSFKFEKEIYLDRFLFENKAQAYEINKSIAILKEKLEQQEKSLQKMSNYKNSNVDILNVIGTASEYLQTQLGFDMMSAKLNTDPTNVGQVDEPEKISIAVDILSRYQASLTTKMESLQVSINNIKNEIAGLNSKLCQHKYHLTSILIHDGSAGSGHYYSFNRNVEKDTWTRMNDIFIIEEKEDVVIKESFGGQGNVSAYCLVYMSDAMVSENKKLKQAPITALNVDMEMECRHYNNFLSPHQMFEVEEDNNAFTEEVEEFKFNNCIKSIIESYKWRFDTIRQALQARNPKSVSTHLNSFGNFLSYDPHFEELLKWYILDCCLMESQLKLGLKQLKSSKGPLNLLMNRMGSLSKPYTFSRLVLTKDEESKMECKLAEYSAEFPIIVYSIFLLDAVMVDKLMDFCFAARSILDMDSNPQSFTFKLVRDIGKIIVLKLALTIEHSTRTGHADWAIKNVPLLTAILKGIIRPEDAVTSQVKLILSDTINDNLGKVDDQLMKKLKEEVAKFNAAFHMISELDKILNGYRPASIDQELDMITNENLYVWKEVDDNAGSNVIKKKMTDFSLKYKGAINVLDRKKYGFYFQ